MAAFQFDNNTWYMIQSPGEPGLSVIATNELSDGGNNTAVVRMNGTNAADTGQQFQFYPTDLSNHTYLIRSNGVGSGLYFGAALPYLPGSASQLTPDNTAAAMFAANVVTDDLSVLWNVTSSDDGYYFLTNYQNGTNRLFAYNVTSGNDDGSEPYLGIWGGTNSSNFVVNPEGYKFNFTAVSDKIDNPSFSFAQSPTAALATLFPTATSSGASTASTTSATQTAATSSSTSSTTHKRKLSGGAIAGIVIGVIAAVAIIAGLGFFLLRRRRRQNRANNTGRTEGAGGKGTSIRDDKQAGETAGAGGTDELAGSEAGHEVKGSPTPRELNGTPSAPELSGSMAAREMLASTGAREMEGSARAFELEANAANIDRHELDGGTNVSSLFA